MESNGKLVTPIALRFCDTDMIGHINNVSFAAYAETGRVTLLEKLGLTGEGVILAHLSLDFLRQVELDDTCEIHTWVEKIGTTSMTFMQEFKAEGETAARIKSVLVSFDYETNEPAPFSDEVRERVRSTALS